MRLLQRGSTRSVRDYAKSAASLAGSSWYLMLAGVVGWSGLTGWATERLPWSDGALVYVWRAWSLFLAALLVFSAFPGGDESFERILGRLGKVAVMLLKVAAVLVGLGALTWVAFRPTVPGWVGVVAVAWVVVFNYAVNVRDREVASVLDQHAAIINRLQSEVITLKRELQDRKERARRRKRLRERELMGDDS